VFICEILANMTQVSDVAPGPLVFVLKMQRNHMKNLLHVVNVLILVNDRYLVNLIMKYCYSACAFDSTAAERIS
jgi:hypothetical protein